MAGEGAEDVEALEAGEQGFLHLGEDAFDLGVRERGRGFEGDVAGGTGELREILDRAAAGGELAELREVELDERQRLSRALRPSVEGNLWVASRVVPALAELHAAEGAEREKLADKRPDPLLRESAAILSDAIGILGQDRKLSAQVLPDSPGPGRWAE